MGAEAVRSRGDCGVGTIENESGPGQIGGCRSQVHRAPAQQRREVVGEKVLRAESSHFVEGGGGVRHPFEGSRRSPYNSASLFRSVSQQVGWPAPSPPTYVGTFGRRSCASLAVAVPKGAVKSKEWSYRN